MWLARRALLFVIAGLLAACNFSSTTGQENAGEELTVLTLNLHTYQEIQTAGVPESELTEAQAQERVELYGPLFDRIAAAINTLDPDFVCLQEVGEWPGRDAIEAGTMEFGASDSNMLHQILRRLTYQHYDYTMDWSHYGFDVWLEGSAILSKHPLSNVASRYISGPENSRHDFWKSRNIPAAQIDLPEFGKINVFSVHTGWWDDEEEPFQSQFRRLLAWAEELKVPGSTTVLCGDFNVAAGSEMQQFMTNGTGYSDQYALANPEGLLDSTVGGGIDGWEDNATGQRIDYILVNDDSPLEVLQSQIIFTQKMFGRVSDHAGVFARFGKRSRTRRSQ